MCGRFFRPGPGDLRAGEEKEPWIFARDAAVLALLYGSIYLVWRLVNSRFGLVVRGARSNETRMRAMGYATRRVRWLAFVLAGFFAGVAGAPALAGFVEQFGPPGKLAGVVDPGGHQRQAGGIAGLRVFQ
mgnify:CR=1 FL=1